jgi:hypothetical protein
MNITTFLLWVLIFGLAAWAEGIPGLVLFLGVAFIVLSFSLFRLTSEAVQV